LTTTNTTKTHRALASLKLPKPNPALITYAQGIVKGMTGNAYFTTPSPALTVLSAAIGDLQTTETLALTRAKGAAAARNEKRATLVSLLQQERSYVQGIADGSPENGASIIQSAGLAVKKVPTHTSRVFAARPGTVSGTVKLVAPAAAHRSSYEWEYSTAPRSQFVRQYGLGIAPGRFGAIARMARSRSQATPTGAPWAAAGMAALWPP
jgi:hypothetical protein